MDIANTKGECGNFGNKKGDCGNIGGDGFILSCIAVVNVSILTRLTAE